MQPPAFSGVPNAKRGDKSEEVATSAWPSWGPKRGRNCYATPAFSGFPTPSAGTNSEVATSPRTSWWPKRERNCYVTPAFSGVPNAKRRNKIRSGYLTPAFSGAQKMAELLCNPAFSGVPNAKRGDKIRRSGYLTLAFSAAQKSAELLCNPYILGGPHLFCSRAQRWGPPRMQGLHSNSTLFCAPEKVGVR